MTIRTVECILEDKLDFTPAANCRPARAIATHVLQASYMIANTIAGETDTPTFKAEQFTSRDALVGALRKSQQYVMERLAKVPIERLDEIATTPGRTEMPLKQWLMILLVHESDHRGNLVVLAKTAGANPPDISRADTLRAAGACD